MPLGIAISLRKNLIHNIEIGTSRYLMCLDYYNYKRRSLSENEKSPIEDSRHLGLTAGNRPHEQMKDSIDTNFT